MVPWILLGFHLHENSKEQSKWFVIKCFLFHSAKVNFVLSLQGEVTSPSNPAAKHSCKDHQLLFPPRRPKMHLDTAHLWLRHWLQWWTHQCCWVRLWQSSCTRRKKTVCASEFRGSAHGWMTFLSWISNYLFCTSEFQYFCFVSN